MKGELGNIRSSDNPQNQQNSKIARSQKDKENLETLREEMTRHLGD